MARQDSCTWCYGKKSGFATAHNEIQRMRDKARREGRDLTAAEIQDRILEMYNQA